MNAVVEMERGGVSEAGQAVPEVRGLPLLGVLPAFLKDNLRTVAEMGRRGDVVKYSIAGLTVYQVSHPDGVQRILQDNNHNYDKGASAMEFGRLIFGNGLVISDGEFWLRQRRLMQPAFHRKRVAGFADLMAKNTESMLERWQGVVGGQVDVLAEMMHLTLRIATEALFSTAVADESDRIRSAMNVLLADVAFRFKVPFYPPASVPTPHNRQFLAALRTLDETVYGLIAQRRRLFESGAPAPDDLLSRLMEARDEETGEGMTDKQLRDEVVTLFIAGHETTANALAWGLYLLSQHPEAAGRLHAEVDRVLGEHVPGIADLQGLAYTRMVVNEALRLYPPGWITNRRAIHDDTVCGYRIPAGSMVAFSPYVIHRRPDFWDEPDAFRPERFAPEAAAGRHHFAYFPFGGGPRMCIGRDFALMEAPLVLAMIAQRFDLFLPAGRAVEPEAILTLRPRGGLPMVLTARSQGRRLTGDRPAR